MMIGKNIYLALSNNRRSSVIRRLGGYAKTFLHALENKNNDHVTNGEFWLIKQLQNKGINTVFDVGANVGKWTLEAANIMPQASVYSFEPIPEVFALLNNNVSSHVNIHAVNKALSDKTGQTTFNYYHRSNLFSSMYSHPEGKGVVKVVVNTLSGDEFCTEHKIDAIGFLKIDAEGSEPLVLTGFHEMLTAKKIKVIQFEYGLFSIETKFLLKDYFEFFMQYGYRVGKIYPNHVDFSSYTWEQENFIGPNYLAVREGERELIKILSNII